VRTVTFLICLTVAAQAQSFTVQTSGRETNLRGISVARGKSDKTVVWASGSKGVILHSIDDGKTWTQLHIADADNLDFRDIQAFGDGTAYAMSSGDGEKSRIYKTLDGGKTWTLQYTDKRSGFFLDSLACDSSIHCFALSDPVDGKFLVLATDDGMHWRELPRDKMPAALPTEGAFAASGTSIAVCDSGIYFGTGGPSVRVFHSADQGRSWTVTVTPMAAGQPSSGMFSIACRGRSLAAVGGDYKEPGNAHGVAIYSIDSGANWHLSDPQPGGYRSALAFYSDHDLITIGTNGVDASHDAGVHWQHIDSLNLNAIDFSGSEGWAVGPNGTIARFKPH
jgi:photosystem II stability/assembly factor-like uncharacterized protein